MAEKSKLVTKITAMLNKKGKIKGKDKKETKTAKASCPHWRINKKGKQVPNIDVVGDYAICRGCGSKIPLQFYDNDHLKEVINNMKELNDQAKFLSVATNSGEEMLGLFSKTGVLLGLYKKRYKKIRKIAEKQSNIMGGKKNKKKNKGNGGGTSSDAYGSWGSM
jgi:hypothetical protein|nr:MAG TPA: DnaK suppressor protein [Caudoviricetes sp.]